MKHPNYPSPCLTCERAANCQKRSLHGHCREWNKWFLWWWKWFQKNLGKQEPQKREKFYYEHPDIIRKYFFEKPCERCPKNEYCTNPCYKYAAWYDVWVEIAKRRITE